jgi:hypothetical protein
LLSSLATNISKHPVFQRYLSFFKFDLKYKFLTSLKISNNIEKCGIEIFELLKKSVSSYYKLTIMLKT